MRLTVLTVGSRGDVQPFLALGTTLVSAGHEVTIATHPKYEPLVSAAGLPFAALAEGRISEGPSTREGARWASSSSRHLPSWVGFLRDAQSVARRRLADGLLAGQGADAILAGDLATVLGWQVAEHHGCPLVRVSLSLPPLGGRQGPVVELLRGAAWQIARPWLDRVRRDVGLSPIDRREPIAELARRGSLVLHAYSARAAPPAAHAGGPQAPHVTGFWFLDTHLDPEPPDGLAAFLAAGPEPVCIGFGSMLDDDPVDSTRVAVQALARAGRRGVLIRGQWGLRGEELPDTVYAVQTVAHDWLFDRCAAVVHHAGAGTTAAVLRAGIPSVPIPHMADQRRWARRLGELGVATAPIARRRLSADVLAEAISAAAGDAGMRGRAELLAREIAAERGTERALELLETHLGRRAAATAPAMSTLTNTTS